MSSPRSGGGGIGLVNVVTATGVFDDDSQTEPLGELNSVATSFDAPTVSVIPALEDLIFFADVGGITASHGRMDEDDDVLLVSGVEWGNADGYDCDDEASKASARSRWKSPRVGGLGIGKKNIGKKNIGRKVSSLARGIVHRQTVMKSHDARGDEEKGRSRRKGSSVPPTRSKAKQKPRVIIDKMDHVNKSAHGMKSPSAAKGILHLISPRAPSTVAFSAAESKDSEGLVVITENHSGALDQLSSSGMRSLRGMHSMDTPPDVVCNAVAEGSESHDEINAHNSLDNQPYSRKSGSCEDSESDQENIHRGSSNLDGDISHRERKGIEDIKVQLGIAKQALDLSAAGDSKTLGRLLLTKDVYKKQSLLAKAHKEHSKREQVQDNDNDTNSSPSSSSWRGKEITVRPRIIDLTPSMVSSDATTSTLAHPTKLSSKSPLRCNNDALNKAKSQNSSKKGQQVSDASFILDGISTATSSEEGGTVTMRRPKALERPETPEPTMAKIRARNEIGTTTRTSTSPSPLASREAAGAAKSPARSFHRQVLMEMIIQDIASATGEYMMSPASTSVRSEGTDDDEDSSRKQSSSVFSFEDESVAMASYSSARIVKELKEELLPSIAVSNRVRRAPTPRSTGVRRQQASALRGPSSPASSGSLETIRTGTKKKKQVSFKKQRDVWYYKEKEGCMRARASEDEAPVTQARRDDIFFEQLDYDDGDGSVFSAADYYSYGGEERRYRGRSLASCGAGSTTWSKEDDNHDDFSQAVYDVLLDWRDMMGQHEAVMDVIRDVSGAKLECLQDKFNRRFGSDVD